MKGFVGMQVHPFDFVDEGVDNVLQNMKSKADVNAVIPIVNMIDERHPPSGTLPHNPKRETYTSRGGYVYFRPQLEHYRKTDLKPLRTDEVFLKDFDILDDTIARSKDYGMKYYAWVILFEDIIHGTRHPECLRVDIEGNVDSTAKLCINNPMARSYYLSLIEDIVTNHEVDGIMVDRLRYFRPDEINNIFSCFCKNCMERAKETGYDAEKLKASAKQANLLLGQISSQDVRVFSSLHYGVFDALKRLMEVNGIFDIIKFRAETVAGFLKEARDVIKDAGEKIQLTINAQCPSYSWLLGQDYRVMGEYFDWLKVMAYPQMRGKMIVNILRSKTLKGLKVEEVEAESLGAMYALLGISGPLKVKEAEKGLPAEYVFNETLRAKSELGAGKPVYAGIQLNDATREDIRTQLRAAKEAKADGVVYITYGFAPFENFEIAREAWSKLLT